MPQVKWIEKRIESFEGFVVRFETETGSNVRSDKVIAAQYDGHVNRAPNTMTVEGWIRNRFRPQFPGFSVKVLYADGRAAHGRTQLRTVRATY